MSADQVELLRLFINDPTGEHEFFGDPKLEEFILNHTSEGDANLNAAAAELWAIKAGAVSTWYTASADGTFLSRDQVFDHCMKMAEFYGQRGGGDPASWRSVQMDSSAEPAEDPWEF